MLTTRDLKIISMIQNFGAVDSGQIYRVFFREAHQGELICRRRLNEIIKHADIKREKDPITGRYIYYTKKAQLRHKVLIAEFYVRLLTGPGRVEAFEAHCSFGDIRPDAFVTYFYREQVYLFFLEVQISANPLNVAKYERLYASGDWKLPVFPRLVVVSDRRWRVATELRVDFVPTSYEGWEAILK